MEGEGGCFVGQMEKIGEKVKNIKRRVFYLKPPVPITRTPGLLCYYTPETEDIKKLSKKSPKGQINLSQVIRCEMHHEYARNPGGGCFYVVIPNRTYQFYTFERADSTAWVERITAAMLDTPFHVWARNNTFSSPFFDPLTNRVYQPGETVPPPPAQTAQSSLMSNLASVRAAAFATSAIGSFAPVVDAAYALAASAIANAQAQVQYVQHVQPQTVVYVSAPAHQQQQQQQVVYVQHSSAADSSSSSAAPVQQAQAAPSSAQPSHPAMEQQQQPSHPAAAGGQPAHPAAAGGQPAHPSVAGGQPSHPSMDAAQPGAIGYDPITRQPIMTPGALTYANILAGSNAYGGMKAHDSVGQAFAPAVVYSSQYQ